MGGTLAVGTGCAVTGATGGATGSGVRFLRIPIAGIGVFAGGATFGAGGCTGATDGGVARAATGAGGTAGTGVRLPRFPMAGTGIFTGGATLGGGCVPCGGGGGSGVGLAVAAAPRGIRGSVMAFPIFGTIVTSPG